MLELDRLLICIPTNTYYILDVKDIKARILRKVYDVIVDGNFGEYQTIFSIVMTFF
jgi:hypothetical protein